MERLRDSGVAGMRRKGTGKAKPSDQRCIRASRASDLREQPRLDREFGTAINHLIKDLRPGFNEPSKEVSGTWYH